MSHHDGATGVEGHLFVNKPNPAPVLSIMLVLSIECTTLLCLTNEWRRVFLFLSLLLFLIDATDYAIINADDTKENRVACELVLVLILVLRSCSWSCSCFCLCSCSCSCLFIFPVFVLVHVSVLVLVR